MYYTTGNENYRKYGIVIIEAYAETLRTIVYPYAPIPENTEMDDYLKYRLSENETMKEWRIRNVDLFIKNVHNELKKLFNDTGKKIEFGISPFPIYRTNKTVLETGWEKGSYHSKGAFQF